MRRQFITVGVIASVVVASTSAFAAPCGPAVLANVDGQVLVNRGAGFMSGAAGMPLAVGDYVMSRGGTAEITYVNGGAASLNGAKSMPITACSADAGKMTDPALAQFGSAAPTGGWNVVPASPTATPASAGVGGVGGGVGSVTAPGIAGAGVAGAGAGIGVGAAAAAAGVAAAAAVGVAVAASTSGSSSNSTIISVSP